MKRILGGLLFIANSTPSRSFYVLKNDLLKRFGTPDGCDIQHIVKWCWSCEQTGIHKGYYGEQKCFKCDGTGIYDNALIRLLRFRLGSHVFHIPDGSICGVGSGRLSNPRASTCHRDTGELAAHWRPH